MRRSKASTQRHTLRLPLEGGGWNATSLGRRLQAIRERDRRAKLDGIPGGGVIALHTAGHPHPARHDHLAPLAPGQPISFQRASALIWPVRWRVCRSCYLPDACEAARQLAFIGLCVAAALFIVEY